MGRTSRPRRILAALALTVAVGVTGGLAALPAGPAAAAEPKGYTTMDKATLRILCRLLGGTYFEWSDGDYSCWFMVDGGSIDCEPDGTCMVYENVRPPEPWDPRDNVVDPGGGVVP